MSIFGDVVRPYWLMIKMGILAIVLGYVGYLHWHNGSLERENVRLQGAAAQCHELARDLTIENSIQAKNIEKIQEYYRNKKCLDLRPGELSDEEFKLQ